MKQVSRRFTSRGSPGAWRLWATAALLGAGAFLLPTTQAAPPQAKQSTTPAASADALEREFSDTVVPFVATYCVGCHSGARPAANIDLRQFATVSSVTDEYADWDRVRAKLAAGEMPPKQAKQPPADARQRVVVWIDAFRKNEVRVHGGDPGVVLARRLSNAEYNNTIRDLTGVDLRPAREFPVDPANQAGFDNSGESLTMSPALMAKYLEAARDVADHLVLKPDGLAFATHPMLADTDREKYAVLRIVDFYDRQPTDFADYFQAAWCYKHRSALGTPAATLAGVAAAMKVSPKYLPVVWQALETREEIGPLATLQTMWRALPVPSSRGQAMLARDGTVRMRDFVARIRKHTAKLVISPDVPGLNGTAVPMAWWKNAQVAAGHRDFDPAALRVEGDPPPSPDLVVTKGQPFGSSENAELKKALAAYIKERQEDPDLVVPAGQRARYEAAFARFSSVFPDKFHLRERGRFYPVEIDSDIGRNLKAGLHSLMGYFRDDTTLRELILDQKGQQEIDRLWQEFEFIADYSRRTHLQFSFNSGGRSGIRPINMDVTSPETMALTKDRYLAVVAPANNPITTKAVIDYFDGTEAAIRWADRAREEAEPRQLEALVAFAARAYRRSLAPAERDEIFGYYRELRAKNNLTHEEAVRVSVAALLVSPDFCYRVDLVSGTTPPAAPAGRRATTATATNPLSGFALASRLSYFLWSSMPDQELLAHAAAGDLQRPDVLLAQTRRMLKDPRARGLATEFGGNWLDFRRFETHNAVDRERFPSFTSELREAMFEEPVRLLDDVIRNNRSVLDLLYGDYTFVNPPLARHYGIPNVTGGSEQWVRVDNASRYDRGGLLPMSVFLTQNSPGLRTSPVKRGYWIVRRVLGEVIPPPPPVVPELPHDEAKTDLPLRDVLAQHRANPACAACHARFDAFGLALEGYGPVGESRKVDLGGRPVDATAGLPGGTQAAGFRGVQTYIRAQRQADFLINLNRKLLAYALSRSLRLSDEGLITRTQAGWAAAGHRFGALVEAIVMSPQFLNTRNTDATLRMAQSH